MGRVSLLNAQTAEGTRAILGRRARARPVRAGDRKGQERQPPCRGQDRTPSAPHRCRALRVHQTLPGHGEGPPRAPAPWRCESSSKIMQDINPPPRNSENIWQDEYPQTPQGPHSGPSSVQWALRTCLPVSASSPHCCLPQRVAGSAHGTLLQTLCPPHSWSQGQGPVPDAARRGQARTKGEGEACSSSGPWQLGLWPVA